jgi:hypothetical protein
VDPNRATAATVHILNQGTASRRSSTEAAPTTGRRWHRRFRPSVHDDPAAHFHLLLMIGDGIELLAIRYRVDAANHR